MAGAEAEAPDLGSLFLDENYTLQRFDFGPHEIPVFSLQSSSTDYDLTGQIIWPGTHLLNSYLLRNPEMLRGASVLELGSGVGLTGLLCGHMGCSNVVMTDHNDIVLKIIRKNVELQKQSQALLCSVSCEKLEWGNEGQLSHILGEHPQGFDLVLGTDICYQRSSISPLLSTVEQILSHQTKGHCKFILGYIFRINSNDLAFLEEVSRRNLQLSEISDSRMRPGDGTYGGIVYEIKLKLEKPLATCSLSRPFRTENWTAPDHPTPEVLETE